MVGVLGAERAGLLVEATVGWTLVSWFEAGEAEILALDGPPALLDVEWTVRELVRGVAEAAGVALRLMHLGCLETNCRAFCFGPRTRERMDECREGHCQNVA